MQLIALTMSCITTLAQKDFRLTPQRRLILAALHDARDHLTAKEISNYVQTRVAGVNASTIYRTLALLEQLGCVFRSQIDGRFIYHHAEEGHHHHLVCRSCGKIIDCQEEVFSAVQTTLKENYGFQAEFKHIIIDGLCRECREKG